MALILVKEIILRERFTCALCQRWQWPHTKPLILYYNLHAVVIPVDLKLLNEVRSGQDIKPMVK